MSSFTCHDHNQGHRLTGYWTTLWNCTWWRLTASYSIEAFDQCLRLNASGMECPLQAPVTHVQQLLTVLTFKFSSKDNNYTNVVMCFILPTLTGSLPLSHVINSLKLSKDFHLVADELNIPGRFDILIGSELYPYLMKKGCCKYGKNCPFLQETHLRWILLVRLSNNQ